ncbi:nitronate monooxygenase [Klebsormidium nitens]|uniref:Nitronate monooxygenase n=1 Tax=Klebsormidium nitens TaxID=105231 RepID=A0A1Y1IDL2_KLENI|nr:nitronate monooxygenase [Klebsormidium nitens]|eukprot:GAQ89055.1 nitronate monooxygenase [Klebsormidium nitens]
MSASVALQTLLTQTLGIAVPVINAPMAGRPKPVAGAELAAAVARAGGLGLIGAAACTPVQLTEEFVQAQALLGAGADPQHAGIGLGLINAFTGPELLQAAIDCQPRAIWLSFGPFKELAPPIKAAGIKLICQVQTLEQIGDVLPLGADVIVAQSYESGGHGASHATTFCFVPEAVDFVREQCEKAGRPPVPVVAAGGVTDSRQIAAVLALGGDGVVLGTRLLATPECGSRAEEKEAVAAAGSDASETPATVRTRLYDDLSSLPWPQEVNGRLLQNKFIADYGARLAGTPPAERETVKAEAIEVLKRSDFDRDVSAVYCGAGVGLVRKIEPAEVLVTSLVTEAKARLQRLGAELAK